MGPLKLRGKNLSLVMAIVASTVVSCSLPKTDVKSLDNIDLDNYIFALYSGVPHTDLIQKDGYIYLVRPDGNIDALQHSPMDHGSFIWDETGINFADSKGVYRIMGRGEVYSLNKNLPNYMDNSLRLGSGDIAYFLNPGFQNNQFESLVVTYDGHNLTETRVPYWHTLATICDGNMYTIARDPTPSGDEARARKRYLFEFQLDNRKKPNRIGSFNLVYGTASSEYGVPPCVGSKIYSLVSIDVQNGSIPASTAISSDMMKHIYKNADGMEKVIAVNRWDIGNGSADLIPITDLKGDMLIDASRDELPAFQWEDSLNEGWMYWVSSLGALYRTNVDDGRSELLLEGLDEGDGIYSHIVSFDHRDRYVYFIRYTAGDKSGSEYHIYEIDLKALTREIVFSFPVKGNVPAEQIVRAIQVSPKYNK